MVCSSCDKQRANLSTKNSRLLPKMKLYLCEECIKAKREPRYVIILAAREFGVSMITEYIVDKRYVGEDILGKEILKKN